MRIRTIVLAVLATACGTDSNPDELPPFEEFRDSLPRVEGSYLVEGDLPIRSEDALRKYYASLRDRLEGLSSTEQGLAINRVNGNDDIYTSNTQLNLTYCISTAFSTTQFPTRHAEIVTALSIAASRWETFLHVNFTHVPAQDSNCTATNTNVWFDVRPFANAFTASAFFPHEPRANRNIFIGPGAGSSELLTHELGHVLGFRHEHARADAGLPAKCKEFEPFRYVTGYDDDSVMHYPSFDPDCGGSDTGYSISRRDRIGAQRFFAPRPNTCGLLPRDTARARSATCEDAYSTTGARHDLYRWNSADTAAKCALTRGGIWTTASSGFAQGWPTAVHPGKPGACITQIGNPACSKADADKCLLHDASCERTFSVTGQRHDLCRWQQNATPALCAQTAGIWTTATSGFAQGWPTSVPIGQAGACVTQVGNL